MYKKVDPNLDFVSRELDILSFWKEQDIYKKSLRQREGREVFSFYDGPPTANGKPHAGHVLTRVIKDLIPRYRTMKGYYVPRKAGWDTHGLPVELEVEKRLGLDGKEQIEAYGVDDFIEACKKSVWKYKKDWEEMSERVGYWVDMENPYITYDNAYIESVWWALRQIWDQNLIYKGHKVVPYCPRCGTSLSSHEVAQGYKDVTEPSIYVRFPVSGEKGTYFAVWTTTPWTLPSNVALCVNAEETYCLVEVGCAHHPDEPKARYYLARALVDDVFGEEAVVLETMPGAALIGKSYQPVFSYANEIVAESGKEAYFVTGDPYVTLTDGTGIVHIAPAFGEDDARIGRDNDLPHVQLIREDGTLTAEAVDVAGMFCKDADPVLIEKLKADGLLLRVAETTHNYPFCWRCDTPLIYYARSTWFIEMTKLRDRLLEHNETINWIPQNIGPGRFGNFLENVVDWSLSRERYWGTPLPIWECEACGHRHLVGSIRELKEMADDCPETIELHKPMIDRVHLTCPKCGEPMTRIPEVIDCWFDSGSMPFAQYHYPFENEDLFKSTAPAKFISEAVDQTRGWFYTMHAISTLLFDRRAFDNCIVLGLVLDGNGIKMSKHLGNVVDPADILGKEGADATRWSFYATSQPWLPTRFSEQTVSEVKRRFMGTLWNTYAFFVLYANIDEFEPDAYKAEAYVEKRTVIDRWIMSRLHSLIREVDGRLERFDITGAARTLQDFVDDLSNWYVRRSRERYWGPEMTDDKIVAYLTLYEVLETLAKLIAPFTPFMAEMIYQNLVVGHRAKACESVHLEDFPVADETRIDRELEADMARLLDIVSLGRAARNTAQLKIRQPLATMMVSGSEALSDELINLIADELNIKRIIFNVDKNELVDYTFKPQLRTLGRRMGKDLARAREVIATLPGRETMAKLRADQPVILSVNGTDYALSMDDFLIEEVPAVGYVTEREGDLTVALSTELTPDLIAEGLVRELVSKIQTMRRDIDFEVTDRIDVKIHGSAVIRDLLDEWRDVLADEVLAATVEWMDDTTPLDDDFERKAWDVNGERVEIALRRHP